MGFMMRGRGEVGVLAFFNEKGNEVERELFRERRSYAEWEIMQILISGIELSRTFIDERDGGIENC